VKALHNIHAVDKPRLKYQPDVYCTCTSILLDKKALKDEFIPTKRDDTTREGLLMAVLNYF